jgi:hypothetical protein
MKICKVIALSLGLIVMGLPQLYAECCGGVLLEGGEVCCEGQPTPSAQCCNGERLKAGQECCKKASPEKIYDPTIECCEDAGVLSKTVIDKLSDCPHRYKRDDYTPSLHVNGCGSTYSQYVVPQGYQHIVSFVGSCNMHDTCYGRCNSQSGAREGCDMLLQLNMNADCYSIPTVIQALVPFTIDGCKDQAAAYYEVLSESGLSLGEGAWDSSQREGCQCCP